MSGLLDDQITEVLLLSEFPRDQSSTGVSRRIYHLEQWFSARGLRIKYEAINSPTDNRGRRSRWRSARRYAMAARPAEPNTLTVVVGLGGPQMLEMALTLSQSRRVLFDACDSWILQARYRVLHDALGTLSPILGAIGQFRARGLRVSYISDRDARADTVISGGADVIVIPPISPPELSRLQPVKWPLQRIVLLADFNSYHNMRGMKIIGEALQLVPASVARLVEAYGPTPPPAEFMIAYKGWAPNLQTIYEGDTGVLVTNVHGSGIPNKILEAMNSGRPMVAHATMARRFPQAHILPYRSARELAAVLCDALSHPRAE